MNKGFIKQVIVSLLVLAMTIVICRFTSGIGSIVLGLAGVAFAAQRKVGLFVTCYLMLPMLTMVSTALVGKSTFLVWGTRVGQLLIVLMAFPLINALKTRHKLPLNGLWAYLFCAVLSSIGGWFPLISYLKIVNFGMFLFGLMLIAREMQGKEEDLMQMRAAFMAFVIFILLGSCLSYFVPSVGYSMAHNRLLAYGGTGTAEQMVSEGTGLLFSGVTNHSQTLGFTAPVVTAWLLCDMLLVAQKVTSLHLLLLGCGSILMFMSRSRTAFVTFVVAVTLIWFYCLPRAQMSRKVKNRIAVVFTGMMFLVIIAAIVLQIKNQTFSKWLRKTEDVGGDTRSLVDAMTASRMGLIDVSMYDFHKNPFLGMGFQVMAWHRPAYQAGMITLFSAPIEKGVLPIMVLGEGGVLGFIVFMGFLCVFYGTCIRRGYNATLTLFTTYIASNMSEASFFSPGGGTMGWTMTVLGGFCIDMIVIRRAEKQHILPPSQMVVPISSKRSLASGRVVYG